MSILNLRSNLMGKFKDFGINSLPVIKKSLDQLNMPIKNSNALNVRILSIDDNKICQKINLTHLEKFGCRVECVHTARSALEKLVLPYKIIFLDVNLPDCTSGVLINLIRSDEGNINQKVPIVLTSSWLNESFKKNYLALGVNEVYIKPLVELDFKKILLSYGAIT